MPPFFPTAKIKRKSIIFWFVKAPFVFLIILFISIHSRADDDGASGPHLEISSISGNLERDMDSALVIQLYNNASYLVGSEKIDLDSEDTRAIRAELVAFDDRITVLSLPQEAGSLAPGDNRTVEFVVRAGGAEVGIYPMQLRVSYLRLSKVRVSGEESLPDVVFEYENVSLEVPLQVKVVLGPKIELAELKGKAVSGKESDLELILTNRGDEPALCLFLVAYPHPPFLSVQNQDEEIDIEPGGFAKVWLSVYADENATAGYYALPCEIRYKDGESRRQNLAQLVYVQNYDYDNWLLIVAVLLFLAGVSMALRKYLPGRRKPRRVLRG